MKYKKQSWNEYDLNELIENLYSMQDIKFKQFNDRIVNTKSNTIGVQIPKLRAITKQISKGNVIDFLNLKMPNILELHIIYSLVLSTVSDNKIAYPYFEKFITTINNWAVCDTLCSEYKIVKDNLNFYLSKIKKYVTSTHEFVVRVGVVLLMKFYFQNDISDVFSILSTITVDKYYVNMGIAWTLSMCYISHPTSTLDYIKNSSLNHFTKYKTYQKILKSRQVSKEDKELIKILRKNL